MTLSDILRAADRITRDNSPAILTSLGVTGTLATAYFTGKATWHARGVLDEIETEEDYIPPTRARDLFADRTKEVWQLYIPAAATGLVTIGCVVGAAKVSSRRTAALTMAYSLGDRAFQEYRDKVTQTFGEGKEQQVRDSIAQDRVTNNPPGEVIVMGGGNILCCELYTQRYFLSDMETLRKAQNDINAKANRHGHATLSDFYELIGLEYTSNSWEMGWKDSKQLTLNFSSVLAEDGRPCLAFAYKDIEVV